MKASDLRVKTGKELQDQLLELKKEQFNMRFQRKSGELQSVARIREVRRTIAQIKTIIGEKQAGTPSLREGK